MRTVSSRRRTDGIEREHLSMASLAANSPPLDFLAAPDLRRWFARWLCAPGGHIFQASLRVLCPADYCLAFDALELGLNQLRKSLMKCSPDDQLREVEEVGKSCGLSLDREALVGLLRFELRHTPATRPKKPHRRKCDTLTEWQRKVREWKRAVPEWELRKKALSASPWVAERAQHKRHVEKLGFDLCAERYPGNADCQLALRRVMAILSTCAISSGFVRSDPNAAPVLYWGTGLLDDVKKCCQQPEGSRKLAKFIVSVLRYGPESVAVETESFAVVYRGLKRKGDLRRALRRLARDARRRKRKGWQRLETTLSLAMNYITDPDALSEKLFDFNLNHYLALKNPSIRRKERIVIFQDLYPEHNKAKLHNDPGHKADARARENVESAIKLA